MNAEAKKITSFPEINRYKPETAAPLLALFDQHKTLQDAPAWLKTLRNNARTALAENGLPTPKLERWKYTNLMPQIKIFGEEWADSDVVYNDPDKLVHKLVDAFDDPPEWLPKLLSARPESVFRYNDMMLWDLCNLFLRDGLYIDVPAGKCVEKPVEITIKGHDNSFFVPRTAFRLGEGAELTIIEYHTGEGHYWNNRLTQIEVGANAKLRHYRIQENSEQAVYSQNTHVNIERDGHYEGFTLTTGAGLSRNQIHAVLTGVNAQCYLSGINLLCGRQHGDTTVEVEHQAAHGTSRQLMRSVLDDQAHGVFQGKAYVHRGAQKTDGSQLSNALLLAEGAEMDTRPELEIYADDVQCGHGATTGELEDEALFYLRSRGLPESEARMLLIEAFVSEVADKLGDETVQETVKDRARRWLTNKG